MEDPIATETPQPPKKRQTKSDIIAHATAAEYIHAHSKPNGGFKGFLHSNLFAALLLWVLSQAMIVGGFIISFYMKSTQLTEWKGAMDATVSRMDAQGTIHGKFTDEREDQAIVVLQEQMRRVEESTRHIEVIESEHRRLTKDVEDLRNGKK